MPVSLSRCSSPALRMTIRPISDKALLRLHPRMRSLWVARRLSHLPLLYCVDSGSLHLVDLTTVHKFGSSAVLRLSPSGLKIDERPDSIRGAAETRRQVSQSPTYEGRTWRGRAHSKKKAAGLQRLSALWPVEQLRLKVRSDLCTEESMSSQGTGDSARERIF